MKVDVLDILAIAGLIITGLGFWLAGYPVALALVGLVLVACGLFPHTRGAWRRRKT